MRCFACGMDAFNACGLWSVELDGPRRSTWWFFFLLTHSFDFAGNFIKMPSAHERYFSLHIFVYIHSQSHMYTTSPLSVWLSVVFCVCSCAYVHMLVESSSSSGSSISSTCGSYFYRACPNYFGLRTVGSNHDDVDDADSRLVGLASCS